MDQGSGARRREISRLPVQDGSGTRWTSGAFVDAGRLTHNPRGRGFKSRPSYQGQRPIPNKESTSFHGFVRDRVPSDDLTRLAGTDD